MKEFIGNVSKLSKNNSTDNTCRCNYNVFEEKNPCKSK